MAQIAVVGSANIDYVVTVGRLPVEGETVMGGDYLLHPGGKGANQAVAAARLGASVAFVGAVGKDEPGEMLRLVMANEEIDLDGFKSLNGVRTGVAFISVSTSGANQIIVSSGANASVDSEFVEASSKVISEAEIVLLQLELGDDAIETAVSLTTGTLIFNPAPARTISKEILARVDILVPNESELALLSNSPIPTTVSQAADLAHQIRGPKTVIVTLGAQGALICRNGEELLIAAPKVDVVDTTAAGDTFCGALAAGIASGTALVASVENAVWAAALSVTGAGAQGSMPTSCELENFMA